ncbi:DUF4124 domain-containing protein [Congregibacter litoralis]|uniref:DUF4124 domain-containing protein n=1 Tax=Congregibacter litoralis KT71 TaxID=314285 RepID=A4ADU0_9GAMM|nr:DUF4124 domain-containing protein [Congregibacter litoralis]EAQ95822.2 Domain protein of unknown function [Congregibacter litoralis KT71]
MEYAHRKPNFPALLARAARSLFCLSILVLIVTPNIHAADSYYRWKDARGNMVVSDRPPSEDIAYEVVSQGSSFTRQVRQGQGAVPAEVVPRPGNSFEQVDATKASEGIEKNPESCARARINLETLDSGARIRIRDENTGELRYLSEEEKLVQRQKAEDIARVHCE